MQKDSFVFYRSFSEAIDDLPEQDQLQLYRAIKEYSLNQNELELKGQAKTLWKLIKPQLIANNKKYKNGSKGAEYGKLGGRPKKITPHGNSNNPNDELPETPVGLFTETPNVNENENVNVNENENENVNGCVSDFPNPQELFLHYWQHTPDVFNVLARIESPKEWERYWKTGPPTCDQVKNAMDNFIADVRDGAIERRYVPSKPDRFVMNGWITKCQGRLGPKKPPNDDDDSELEKRYGKRFVPTNDEEESDEFG